MESSNEASYTTLLDVCVTSSDNWKQLVSEITENELASELLHIGCDTNLVFNVLYCGTKTGEYLQKCDCGVKLRPLMHHCSLRTCFPCSKIRQRRIKNQYLPYLNNHQDDRGYKMRYLTISPESYDTEEEGLIEVRKAWSRFLETDYAKERIKGGLYVLEVVENWVGKRIKDSQGRFIRISDKHNYHVHMHLILYSSWMQNRKIDGSISELNKNLNKAFKRSVFPDIKLISENSNKYRHNKEVLEYLLQYVSSFDNDFENLTSFAKHIKLIKGKRLITTFGSFYKNRPPKYKPDCMCSICRKKKEYIFSPEVINHWKSENPNSIFIEKPPG